MTPRLVSASPGVDFQPVRGLLVPCVLVCCVCRKLYKLTKTFSGAGSDARELPLALAEEGKNKVAAFQNYMPLINAVCNQGLRERHWAAIADIVGFEVKQDEVSACKHNTSNPHNALLSCKCLLRVGQS